MRLNRLDLIRYGRFQNAQIVFPRPKAGAPDVTVIFGRNEAGKSTAFHAWLDLLFGFKVGAHPAAFRFDRSDLFVGADLDLPGRSALVVRRNGKRTGSLLDAEDRPLNDAILSSALHGLQREQYEERFSLDDRGLKEGGARIAGAQGDLGQLLHAGLSGLTGMGQALDALSARADEFHKKRGRSTTLKLGVDRLKDIGRALRAARLTTEGERNLRQARDRATAAFDAADAMLQQAAQRQAASGAAQVWYDCARDIADLTAQLADYPDGPDLPGGTGERVAALVARIAALEARQAEAVTDIARQGDVIAANPADPQAPALAAALARLDAVIFDGAPLVGRAGAAQADLGNRRMERDAVAREIARVAGLLGAGDVPVADLALDTDALETLTEAVNACTSADQGAVAAQRTHDMARDQLGDAPAAPQDLTALRAAFQRWTAVADVTAVVGEARAAAARLTRAVASLPARWPDLVAAGLPARPTLDDAARQWVALAAERDSAAATLDAHAAELALAEAELAAQAAMAGAVDVAAIEGTRQRRDWAWQQHRDDMTAPTADAFATAMQADDVARAHYLTGAEARQRHLTAHSQRHAALARHATAQARLVDLTARHDALTARCAGFARALGLADDTSPQALALRQQAVVLASDAAADLAVAMQAQDVAEADRHAAMDALGRAAAAVGLDPAQDLPGTVQRALTLEDGDRKTWTKWQRDAQAVAGLADDAAVQQAACQAARVTLDALMVAVPLPDRSRDAVAAALPHLRRLQVLQASHKDLSGRIVAMEQAIAVLAQGAVDLAGMIGASAQDAGAQPLAMIDRARVQVQVADRATERREAAEVLRSTAEATRRRADADLQAARVALAACFDGQGAVDMAPDARALRIQDRDRLRAQVAAAERARQAARSGVDATLFAEELALMPDATRAAALAQALTDAQGARDAARDAAQEAKRLYAVAFAAADTGALATEQATVLADLREGARQAAVARLGVLAARGALRRLAAERRSGMLRDVEDAFVTMTTPAWTGVDVWTQGAGDRLVGVQPDSTTVPVDAMSTGTMGQLYFALRIAGYRSFARDPGPLPMILDDIMETFDDTRARAALQLCAQIGATGQAILFTHHAHLVRLAQDTIPGVGIVQMPD